MAGSTIPANVVIRINDRDITNSFTAINKEVKKLERELKGMVQGTDEFNATAAELAAARVHFDRVREGMNQTSAAATNLNREASGVSGTFGNLRGNLENTFASLLSGQVSFRSLGTTIKTFAAESWAAIGSIPVVGWIVAIVAAVGLAVREILQYNEELQKANELTGSITKLQGEALDQITLKARAMKKAFGFEDQETLEAAKALVGTYKVSYLEALDEIEKGAVKGGKTNKEYLESIREYPTFFAKAGYSLKEFVAIVNAGYDVGIFKDKLPDAIKEFKLSVEEQTPAVKDALVNAFGAPFATDLLQKINNGKITVKQGLEELSKESEKYNLKEKQQAQLTADLFRGAGEDAGGFLKIMEAVTQAADDLNRPLTETEQILKKQVDQFNELETAKYDAMESDSVIALKREFDIFWKDLQIGYYNFLGWIKIADREFQASAIYMRGVFLSLPKAASKAFSAIIDSFSVLLSGLESGTKAISSFFSGDFDQAEKEFERFKNKYSQFKKDFLKSGDNFSSDLNTGGIALANKFRKDYDATTKANAEAQRLLDAKKTNDFDGSGTKANDAKKAADKAAKEAAAARKKQAAEDKRATEERQKDLEDSLKQEADANNRSLELEIQLRIDKAKIKGESLESDILLADLERSKELNSQRKQQDEILKNIEEFQEKIKNAKSGEAKTNFENGLADERALLQTHDEIIVIAEKKHQLNLKTIREKWSAQEFEELAKNAQIKIAASRRIDEAEINDITSLAEAKEKLKDNEFLSLTDKELRAITDLETAKSALREAADRKALGMQKIAVQAQIDTLTQALSDPALSEAARNKILADLDLVKEKLEQIRGAGGKSTSDDQKVVDDEGKSAKEAVDVLGFSVQQWNETFSNLDTTADKLKAVGMVFTALANIGTDFNNLMKALGEKELNNYTKIQDKKKASLEKQLNEGYITNEDYNKQIQKIEAETANKKAELEYKQAKADKISRIFAIIGNTAVAISSALAAPFPINTYLPFIVGALGAVQLGVALAQPLPEKPSFADGGFTGSGFGSPDASGYKPAGIVHEKEWVAPEWMTQNPRTAKVIDYLESVRLGKTKPMANGGYPETTDSIPNPSDNTTYSASTNAESDSEMKNIITRVGDFLYYLIKNGVVIEKTAKNGKAIDEMREEWISIKNKNKH